MNRKMALCAGRHNIPNATDGAIFPAVVNPIDIDGINAVVRTTLQNVDCLDLYVTGLSVALVAVVDYCVSNGVGLTLWHYNVATGDYYPQPVAKSWRSCPFCGHLNPPTAWYCGGCGESARELNRLI
jgi:hypothetical protein